MSALAERRRHKRYEIELPGRIGPVGAALAECVVRDYCSGGMLIELLPGKNGTPEAPLKAGQPVELKVELLTGKGARRLRVDAEVAWISEGYLGAAFPQASHTFVGALQQHDRLARVEAVPALHIQQGGGPRHLAKLRHMALGHLPALLKDLLLRSQGDLLDEADKGGSDKDRQQIYTDVTAIEQPGIAERLLKAILHAALEAPPTPKGDDEGELALVDPDEFERWLEASRVSNLLQQHFTQQLGDLATRLAALHDAAEPGTLTVPFEPRHFTEPLKELARELQLGKASRSVLFNRAAGLLKDKLDDFYSEFDRTLDTLGLPGAAPRQRPKIRRAPYTDRQPAARGPAVRPPQGQPALPGDVSQFVLSTDLLQALQAREASQREDQARELMGYVGEVPNMTASLATWLDQLNGLLLRAAAADETFFHNTHHPLRSIVDGLGHLQMFRRRPDLSPAEDPLQARVADLLRAIDYENVDTGTLRAVSESLDKLTAEQSRLYQRNVERVAEASAGRDRVRRARATVSEELNRRYAGHRVPALVPELLEVGWRAVLELALLGESGVGMRYPGLLEVLDALVARLGGEAYQDSPAPLEADALLDKVEGELVSVAFDPFRRKALEARLRAELSRPGLPRSELVEMAPLPVEDDVSDSGTPPPGVDKKTWQHALDRCAMLKVGDHLYVLDAPEGRQELRVAWIRADRELFTLVDYRGLRVRDITLFDLALGLHRHRIELNEMDGRPLSERAVDAMLSRMQARLSHQTAHDSLTGLIGRKQFHGVLGKALMVPGRDADFGVLLWVDLDQFGLVNELYGYDVGDRLLIALAQVLEQIKGAKVLAHLDSDHFGVLLPDLRLADGERRAGAICEAVRNLDFDWPGQGMNLSVSVGVAGLGGGASGVAGLLRAADAALAQAKADGGDRSYVYHENDPGIAQRTEAAKWLVRVDEALEHGTLRLRCQPIVPVRPNEGLAPHYEVLLGVQSGAGEALPVAQFIMAAETYNRMRAVDRWVVRSTMEWIARHREHMPALHGFAVNLSGQTASDPGFVEFVRQQFRRTQIEPAWLSFEITETAAVGDMSRTAGIIRELKAMGCMVALDDFGSGLASYQYLKELPVDWLKIDGAFVRKIAASEEDHAVVKSINEIGHFLGKKTIAEYVADAEILRRVGEIGVDFAQGFGISPPLPLDELGQSVQRSVQAARQKAG